MAADDRDEMMSMEDEGGAPAKKGIMGKIILIVVILVVLGGVGVAALTAGAQTAFFRR